MPLSSKALDYTLKLLFVAIFVLVCVIFTSVLTFSNTNSNSNSSATKFTGDHCPTYRTVTKHVDPIAVLRSVDGSEASETALAQEPEQAHQFPAPEPILMNAPPPTSARSKWHGSIRDNLQWTPLTQRRDPKHIDTGLFPLNRNRKPIKASEFTFVTSANDHYYSELLHFLGKCHRFAPSHRIIVYDLGMSEEQLVVVRQLYRVHIVPREEWQSAAVKDFGPVMHARKSYISPTELPSHINDPKSFAWKPLVMWDALNRLKVGAMIYLDAGVELVRYPGWMVELMEKRGYVYVAQEGRHTGGLCCGPLGELTFDATFRYLGLNKADYADKLMSAGGIQAYREVQPDEGGQVVDAINLVLRPVAECGWDINCMAPPGSSLDNHRQDQSVFSIFVHKSGLNVETDYAFWGNGRSLFEMKTPAEYERATVQRRRFRSGKWDRGHAEYSIRRLKIGVVVPFDAKNLAELEGIFRQFEEMIPCRKVRQQSGEPWYRQDEGVQPVDTGLIFDLILYANYLDGDVKSQYEKLINDGLSKSRSCFNAIILTEAGVDGLEPLHEQRIRFERLWIHGTTSLKLRGYSHYFTVDRHSVIMRSGWLDGMLDQIRDHIPDNVRRVLQLARSDRVTQPFAVDEPDVTKEDGHTPLDYYYSGSWWMMGGSYEGRAKQLVYYPMRIHHTAVFHLTMNFYMFVRELIQTIPSEKSSGPDYDLAILLYGTKDEMQLNDGRNWHERQLMNGLHRHRFIVSEYVHDCGSNGCNEFHWMMLDHTETYFAYQTPVNELEQMRDVLTTLPEGPNGPHKSSQYTCPPPPPCPIKQCPIQLPSASSTPTIVICPNVTTLEIDSSIGTPSHMMTGAGSGPGAAAAAASPSTVSSMPSDTHHIPIILVVILILLIAVAVVVFVLSREASTQIAYKRVQIE